MEGILQRYVHSFRGSARQRTIMLEIPPATPTSIQKQCLGRLMCPRLYINGNANYIIPGHMSGSVFEVLSTATQICMWSKYGNSLFIRTSTPGRPRRLPGRRGSDQRGKRGRRHRPHLLVHCLCGGRPRPRSRPAAPRPRPLLPR